MHSLGRLACVTAGTTRPVSDSAAPASLTVDTEPVGRDGTAADGSGASGRGAASESSPARQPDAALRDIILARLSPMRQRPGAMSSRE